MVKMSSEPIEYLASGGGVFCDECRATIHAKRGDEFWHCEKSGYDICKECGKPSIRELIDLEKHDIGKIGFKVFTSRRSNLQLYYGIRLYDRQGKKILNEDFCC